MAGFSKGIRKVEVALKWDPSPAGRPPTDLDIVAAPFESGDPYGAPAYLVHFDSRSPDGTIFLNRDSKDGKGFGWDEVMTLELDRLDGRYARVVVGVVIQQGTGRQDFANVLNPGMRIREGYTVLAEDDFTEVAEPRRPRSASSTGTTPAGGRSMPGSTASTRTRRPFPGSWAAGACPEGQPV